MDEFGIIQRIVMTADTCHGRPRINGTRMPVESVLGYLISGDSPQKICDEYRLHPDDITACLIYAQRLVQPIRANGSNEIWDKTLRDNPGPMLRMAEEAEKEIAAGKIGPLQDLLDKTNG